MVGTLASDTVLRSNVDGAVLVGTSASASWTIVAQNCFCVQIVSVGGSCRLQIVVVSAGKVYVVSVVVVTMWW